MSNKEKLQQASKLISEVLADGAQCASPTVNKKIRKDLAAARKLINGCKPFVTAQ